MKILITESQLSGILNEAYSEKLILRLINKYREQSSDDDNIIRQAITRFDQIKDSPQVKQKDITKYSWDDLKKTVDTFQQKRIKAGTVDKDDTSDLDLIYKKSGFRIYQALSTRACVKYGNGYEFCISSRGHSNEFMSYAFEDKGTIYFIFDDNKSSEKTNTLDFFTDNKFIDPQHLLVIIVYDISKYKPYQYTITEADNENTELFFDFDEALKKYPQLRNLAKIFQPIDLSNSPDMRKYNLLVQYQGRLEGINNHYERNHITFEKLYTFKALINVMRLTKYKTSNSDFLQPPSYQERLIELYHRYMSDLSRLKR